MIIENYNFFIFDLDNTIVKTEIYHYRAWLSKLQSILG